MQFSVFTSPITKSAKYSALCYNSSGELTRIVTGYVYVPANEKVKKKDGYNLNFKDKYDIQKINIYFYWSSIGLLDYGFGCSPFLLLFYIWISLFKRWFVRRF